MKTSELTGAALDWAVAKVLGLEAETLDPLTWECTAYPSGCYNYSTDWSQGGPIIEREGITVVYRMVERVSLWTAYNDSMDDPCEQGGPTPLIAAMRCYVASNLNDEINVPEELK